MNRKTTFLLVSLLIALLDGLFVAANYVLSHEALQEDLNKESATLFSAFTASLRATESNLLLIASVFANDAQVQALFRQARDAVAAEGGGPGGERAARLRQQLLDYVGPRWQQAMHHLGARQLHFHLGPGSLSFLRVHRPKKFGDRMDQVRFTVVDTNAEQTARTGFETGRVYSGIRGVVPVFTHDPVDGRREHLGALEAGVSFKNLVTNFQQATGSNVTILLTREHIESAMWPESIAKRFKELTLPGGYVIEASSKPVPPTLFRTLPGRGDRSARIQDAKGRYYHTAFFPLRDYRGQKEPGRSDVGSVVLWKDVSARVGLFQRNQWFNAVYAVIAYLLVELILFLGFRRVTSHLEQQVESRTEALVESRNRLLTLIDASPDLICFKDGEGRWLEANEASQEHFGLKHKPFRGKTNEELAPLSLPPFHDLFPTWQQSDERVWEQHEAAREQIEIPVQGASSHLFDVLRVPIFDNFGERQGLVVIGRDISADRRARAALAAGEARNRSFFAHSQAPMLLLEPDSGWIVDANNAAGLFYGHSPEELKQLHLCEISLLSEEAEQAARTEALAMGRNHFRSRHRGRDGVPREVEILAGPLELEGRRLDYYIIHDLSGQLHAEADARHERDLLQAIADTLPEPLRVIDPRGRVLFSNHSAHEALPARLQPGGGAPQAGGTQETEQAAPRRLSLPGSDGIPRDYEVLCTNLTRADGRVIGVLERFRRLS